MAGVVEERVSLATLVAWMFHPRYWWRFWTASPFPQATRAYQRGCNVEWWEDVKTGERVLQWRETEKRHDK